MSWYDTHLLGEGGSDLYCSIIPEPKNTSLSFRRR